MDAGRTRYVVAHYAQMQGLRIVPVGCCFVASAMWRAGLLGWLPGIAGRGAQTWFLSSLAIAIALSFVIRNAYHRRVGTAYPRATGTGAVTLTVSLVAVALVAPPAAGWPVLVPALFVASVLAGLGLVEDGIRRHYLAIAAACVIFACTPLAGLSVPARGVALDLLIGFGLIVGGVGDHLALERTLKVPGRAGGRSS